MSGTSADGIDAALVDFSQATPRLIDFLTHPINYQDQLNQINQTASVNLNDLSKLHRQIGEHFAHAAEALIQKTNLSASQILAIGSHGQTIFHAPHHGMSLQIGHPAIIAKQTGIMTAADFRIDDMALGGQGAPLAPAFHRALLNPKNTTCVINIGGISNLTILHQNGQVTGYDTGPGNALMDEICQQYFNQPYDRDGAIAAQVNTDQALLQTLLQHRYFEQTAPKSTGRETFNQTWLTQQINGRSIDPKHLISTLNQLTVETLAQSLETHQLSPGTECYICGGGALNQTLLHRLQKRLPNLNIHSIQQLGFDPNAIEAMMCAWLAKQRLENIPVDLTHTTGSSRPATLGGIWQA
jgi:anhydro-N-acetylmuramic acid kinase